MTAGADPDNLHGTALIGELSIKSAEFRRWWSLHEVPDPAVKTKRVHHNRVGPLTLSYESLSINSAPGQFLIVYHAEPGSPTEHGLEQLRSRTVLQHPPSADVSPIDIEWFRGQ